jgi:cryptochrome
VRHFVPELEAFDDKYIYEPHKAPVADQKKWGCVVRGDGTQTQVDGKMAYPEPMFDFAKQRELCLRGMKNAYQIGLYGNDPRVLDGSWRKLFDDAAEGPTEGESGLPGAMVACEEATGEEEIPAEVPKQGNKGGGNGVGADGPDAEVGGKRRGAKGKREVHKRDASQSTLDGIVTRKKAKS